MTKIEIIDETVAFYQKNPRAKNGDSCVYLTDDGRKCAHSRCLDLPNEVLEKLDNNQAGDVIAKYGDKVHKSEYQGHSPEFWVDIQNLHDIEFYWEENQLTKEGLDWVYTLKQKYKENKELYKL